MASSERIKKLNERIAKHQAEIEASKAELMKQEQIIRDEQDAKLAREKDRWAKSLVKSMMKFYPIPVSEIHNIVAGVHPQ